MSEFRDIAVKPGSLPPLSKGCNRGCGFGRAQRAADYLHGPQFLQEVQTAVRRNVHARIAVSGPIHYGNRHKAFRPHSHALDVVPPPADAD